MTRAEVVRTLVERWNAGSHEVIEIERYFDPEIELCSPFSSVAGEGYRGYAGIEQWVRDVDEQFSEWSIRLEDVHDTGEAIRALASVSARARSSDVPLTVNAESVWAFSPEDRVVRIEITAL